MSHRSRSARSSLVCGLALLASIPLAEAAGTSTGRWTLLSSGPGRSLVVTLQSHPESGADGWTSRPLRPESLRGLPTDSDFFRGQFEIARAAGTFQCEGTFKRGKGSGDYTFVPNLSFAQGLAKRGVGTPTAAQQFVLALHDVGFDLVDELERQAYPRPTVAVLVEMGIHGVDVEYVRGMDRVGSRLRSTAELIRMRDHGVDPDFIESLGRHGFRNLGPPTLLLARDHGVDADYVEDLAQHGYRDVSLAELVRARDHGVDAAFLRRLERRGVTGVSLARAIELRDRGLE